MKKLLLIFLCLLFMSCSSVVKNNTLIGAEIKTEVETLPVTADLAVSEQKARGEATGLVTDINNLAKEALAKALGQDPPSVDNYDVLVGISAFTETDGPNIKVIFIGYPANYANFRTATEEDSLRLNMVNTGTLPMAEAEAAAAAPSSQEDRAVKVAFKTGIRAGLNLSSLTYSYKSESEETDNSTGFHAGFVADRPLMDVGFGTLYFNTGILFSQKGGENSKTNGKYEYKENFSLNYLLIPEAVSLRVPIDESLAARANFGVYTALGLFGTYEREAYYDGEKIDSDDTSIFEKGMLNRFDFGLSFGGGVEFKNFYAGIVYEIGLINIADTKDKDFSIDNSTFGLTFGLNF